MHCDARGVSMQSVRKDHFHPLAISEMVRYIPAKCLKYYLRARKRVWARARPCHLYTHSQNQPIIEKLDHLVVIAYNLVWLLLVRRFYRRKAAIILI